MPEGDALPGKITGIGKLMRWWNGRHVILKRYAEWIIDGQNHSSASLIKSNLPYGISKRIESTAALECDRSFAFRCRAL